MTISSSLNAGVAGLNANANRLSTIADNIANSGTYGYKTASTDFYSVVVVGGSDSSYTAGGVRTTTMRLIDERGPLIGTTNPTDIAVNGQGFLPVTTMSALGNTSGDYPVSLTTTGSFRPDADGILRTDSGEVLMGWPANPDGSMPTVPRDSMSALEPIQINLTETVSNPTTQIGFGVNLPATETDSLASGDPIFLAVEYFSNMGTTETLDVTFTPTIPATGSSNEWTMTITDSASGGAAIGEYVVTFDDSPGLGGTIATVVTVNGAAYDPATGTIALPVPGGDIDLVLGVPGETGGMSQLSSTFTPTAITKDGSPVARLLGVEIDTNGNLYAVYDQGFTKRIYQVPVVDVANPNGMISQSNQTFAISPAAGAFYLWDAGDGPTGTTAGYSRELSATDVAGELTQLIETQRAYSSNAKIIQTVDEMLQETTNIKR